MNEFEYLKKSKNEIITIDNLNKKNDCFIRYLFSDEGNENIVLDFINGVMIDLNFQTFNNVVILNPFNLTKYLDGKESIVDVKCITEDNQTVIIEIQLQGNQYFIRRSLYYWANSYAANLKKSKKYDDLNPVISINIVDFNLTENKDKPHSCYFIKEFDTNEILTNHFEMHFLELKKFNEQSKLYEPLSDWFKFLSIKENLEDKMKVLVEKNPIMKEIYDKYNNFVKDDNLTEGYTEWEENYFKMLTLSEERLQGRLEEKEAMATAMKKDGADINLISKYTGLTID